MNKRHVQQRHMPFSMYDKGNYCKKNSVKIEYLSVLCMKCKNFKAKYMQ